jgi:hypothetical protein
VPVRVGGSAVNQTADAGADALIGCLANGAGIVICLGGWVLGWTLGFVTAAGLTDVSQGWPDPLRLALGCALTIVWLGGPPVLGYWVRRAVKKL